MTDRATYHCRAGCHSDYFDQFVVAQRVTRATFAQHLAALRRLQEDATVSQLKQQHDAQLDSELKKLLEMDEQQRRVHAACKHITDDILLLRCPRCGLVSLHAAVWLTFGLLHTQRLFRVGCVLGVHWIPSIALQ